MGEVLQNTISVPRKITTRHKELAIASNGSETTEVVQS